MLKPISPFRLDLTAWALRRRPDNVVDRWDGKTYHKAIVLGDEPVEVAVQQTGTVSDPSLIARVTSEDELPNDVLRELTLTLEKMLGLNADLSGFYEFAGAKSELKPLMERFCGLKPPRFPSVFEALVNGITCQQLTLTLGIQLLNKLATKYGVNLILPTGPVFAFPRPVDLAVLQPEDFRALGYSRQKGKVLIELSTRIVNGELDLGSLEGLSDESALEKLREMHGVGPWTSSYVLLRGLGRIHAFPVYDVGGRNSLQHWLRIPHKLGVEEAERILSGWKPYAGLLYFHLLLERLREGGVID